MPMMALMRVSRVRPCTSTTARMTRHRVHNFTERKGEFRRDDQDDDPVVAELRPQQCSEAGPGLLGQFVATVLAQCGGSMRFTQASVRV